MPSAATPSLIAVDIGNSRIKLGCFERGRTHVLPAPSATLDLPITARGGAFDAERLAEWLAKHVLHDATWLIASVHRGAAERFASTVTQRAAQLGMEWPLRRITHLDIPMPIRVDEPPRVGIDRLLAALAANRVRQRDRGAVIVDLGSAMTIDLVDADGAFLGGAILPGIAMSARALAEQTDALPQLGFDWMDHPPAPLGKSTAGAIEAGLYWGAIGAIRELLRQYSTDADTRPDLFLTGGASAQVVELLAAGGANEDSPRGHRIQHAPNLVLAGIALVDEVVREQ